MIAYSTGTYETFGSSTGFTTTATLTISGSNQIAFAAIRIPNTFSVTTCSFNAQAMTLLGSAVDSGGIKHYLYYKAGPTTGKVGFGVSGGSTAAQIAVAVYTGVDVSGGYTNTTSSTNTQNTLTSTTNNSWHITSGAGSTVSEGSGTTLRQKTNDVGIFDSGNIETAGSNTLTVTGANSTVGIILSPIVLSANLTEALSMSDGLVYGKIFSELVNIYDVTYNALTETISVTEQYFKASKLWKFITKVAASTWTFKQK